jgi:Lsr2 protein
MGELSALPRAAVVVEQSYARIFTAEHVQGAKVADGLAELQVRWPSIPIVYCDTRKLAEEWTYRYLAAADTWARDEPGAQARIRTGAPASSPIGVPAPPPSSAELRAWARANGYGISDRGRVSQMIQEAWNNVHGR